MVKTDKTKGHAMGGKVINVDEMNGYDPSSLDAWRLNNTRLIRLTEKLAVKVKNSDVALKLADKNNPLMTAFEEYQKNASDGGMPTEKLSAVIDELNNLLIEFVISPPLLEQGVEGGISINDIPFDFKMIVFTEMMGGQGAVNAAINFSREESGGVVAR